MTKEPKPPAAAHPSTARALIARLWRGAPRSRLVVLTTVLGLLVVEWQRRLIGDFRIDDAYLSFAFSKNLALGKGLVYGYDLVVEGYSNFLWVVVVGVIDLFVRPDPYVPARVAAFLCLAGALAAGFQIALFHTSQRFAALVVLMLCFSTDLVRAAQSALETVPYAFLLTLTTLVYLREPVERRRASGYCLLLLCLLRIDGFVHALYFVGFELCRAAFERRLTLKATLRWLFLPASLYAGYFAWRYSFYGLLWPAPYYAKATVQIEAATRGIDYLRDATIDLGLPLLLLGAAYTLGRGLSVPKLFLSGLVAGQLAYAARVGGDWMPFNRFLLPVLPAFALLFIWGVSDLVEVARAAGRRALLLASPVVVGLVVGVAVLWDSHSLDTPQEQYKFGVADGIRTHTEGLVRARSLYRHMLREPGESLATDYGGVFAVFTEARVIEMWGLCNAEIALKGTTELVNSIYGRACIDCVRRFEPRYFHANVPLARPVNDITSHGQIVPQVFLGRHLDGVLDFRKNYVAGRVVNTKTKLAFYFLERFQPDVSYEARRTARNIVVEYPFSGSRP